jgi:hypothetical protein
MQKIRQNTHFTCEMFQFITAVILIDSPIVSYCVSCFVYCENRIFKLNLLNACFLCLKQNGIITTKLIYHSTRRNIQEHTHAEERVRSGRPHGIKFSVIEVLDLSSVAGNERAVSSLSFRLMLYERWFQLGFYNALNRTGDVIRYPQSMKALGCISIPERVSGHK